MKKFKCYKLKVAVNVVLIISFIITVISCDNKSYPKCDCEIKDHLGIGEKCCDGINCVCEQMIYGSFTDISGNIINIYRYGNVTEILMEIATVSVIEAYNIYCDDSDRIRLNNKLDSIHIVPIGEWGCYPVSNGKYIIKFEYTGSTLSKVSNFRYYLDNIIEKE